MSAKAMSFPTFPGKGAGHGDCAWTVTRARSTWVETLILPEPAGTWEAYASTLYSDDGRSATNHLSLVPDDGWIGNAWCVGEGDPTGDHKIIVEIAGAVVATFDFTVEKLK